jgi:hypothetical protein
LYAKFSKCEF